MARKALLKTLGDNARAWRAAAKLTQPQVVDRAKRHGYVIDQGTISRIERGAFTASIEVIEALAAGLDVDPWQLLVPDVDAKNPPMLAEASERQKEFWRKLQKAAQDAGITS